MLILDGAFTAWTGWYNGYVPDGVNDGPRPSDQSEYYPTNQMRIAGELPIQNAMFNKLREEFLLGYTYNTARAYWSDLEQIADWAEERGKDVLALNDRDLKQYVALLRRRKYSEHTIRRRRLVYSMLRQFPPGDAASRVRSVDYTPQPRSDS